MDMGWTNHSAFDWFVYFGQSILFFNSFLPLFSILPFHLLPSLKPRHFFHYPPLPPKNQLLSMCVRDWSNQTQMLMDSLSHSPNQAIPLPFNLCLYYLQTDQFARVCYDHNVSVVVPFGLLQMFLDPGDLAGNFELNPVFNLRGWIALIPLSIYWDITSCLVIAGPVSTVPGHIRTVQP